MDALHIIAEADAEKADAALERLMEDDAVEREILEELRDARPLADPAAFPTRHRAGIRALEVYARNARRPPAGLPVSFLAPVVTPFVTLITTAISHYFQKRVVRHIRRLYLLREAHSEVGTPEHRMLTTARRQLDAIIPDLSSISFALPVFLIGGALLSATTSALHDLLHDSVGRIALLGGVLLVTVGAFWCVVTAASITRRRTHLILDQPLAALWQAIGNAGRPPHEHSRSFVVLATVLLITGWIVAPLAAALILSLT